MPKFHKNWPNTYFSYPVHRQTYRQTRIKTLPSQSCGGCNKYKKNK